MVERGVRLFLQSLIGGATKHSGVIGTVLNSNISAFDGDTVRKICHTVPSTTTARCMSVAMFITTTCDPPNNLDSSAIHACFQTF